MCAQWTAVMWNNNCMISFLCTSFINSSVCKPVRLGQSDIHIGVFCHLSIMAYLTCKWSVLCLVILLKVRLFANFFSVLCRLKPESDRLTAGFPVDESTVELLVSLFYISIRTCVLRAVMYIDYVIIISLFNYCQKFTVECWQLVIVHYNTVSIHVNLCTNSSIRVFFKKKGILRFCCNDDNSVT